MELSLVSVIQPLRRLIAPFVVDFSCCCATAQSLLYRCCGQTLTPEVRVLCRSVYPEVVLPGEAPLMGLALVGR